MVVYLTRSKPSKIDVCEALLRRAILSEQQRMMIEANLLKQTIGYEGECFADSYWQDLRLTQHHGLLHNLQIRHDNKFSHQMDTVFICNKFLLIVELKYIAGELYYDENTHQFWRVHNGQRLALGDPFAQVSRHEMWMSRFLWDIHLDVPIVTAVVITAKSALLSEMPKQFHIFKLDGLALKLKQWFNHYPNVLSNAQVDYAAKTLVKLHQPQRWHWQQHFPNLRLKEGIYCECGERLAYRYGSFSCSCGVKKRDVHLQALSDYRHLNGEWISNGEFRKLVGIQSEHAANKVLKRLQLEERGKTKQRQYRICQDIRERKSS